MKVLFIIGVLFTLSFSAFATKRLNEIEAHYIMDNLREYGRAKNISQTEVMSQVGALVLNSPKTFKGGFGTVSKGVYVKTGTKHNEMKINGEDWVGLAREVNEVIYTDGQRFSKSIENFDLDQLVVVIFAPSEIRYIDYINSRGGVYLRK